MSEMSPEMAAQNLSPAQQEWLAAKCPAVPADQVPFVWDESWEEREDTGEVVRLVPSKRPPGFRGVWRNADGTWPGKPEDRQKIDAPPQDPVK